MRALFVDDEVGFLDIITKRMNRRGVEATGVSSGEAALALLQENPVDVVVLDVKMPGCKSGIEILKEIKSRWPMVEVIMLSGHALLGVARNGMACGAFDYIIKPADFDELFYKIGDACHKKRLQEAKIRGIDDLLNQNSEYQPE